MNYGKKKNKNKDKKKKKKKQANPNFQTCFKNQKDGKPSELMKSLDLWFQKWKLKRTKNSAKKSKKKMNQEKKKLKQKSRED